MNPIGKTTLLLLIATTTAYVSNAQSKWSAGYQAAYGTLNSKTKAAALTNQLFINRKISKKIEIEAAIGITKDKGETISDNIPTGGFYSYTIRHTTYNFTLSGKYHFIQKNNWSIFVPLTISNGYTKFNTKFAGNFDGFTWLNDNHHETKFAYCVTTGLGANLAISKHLYLNAQFNIGVQTQKAFGSFNERNAYEGNTVVYSPQAGIGYRF